MQLAKNQKMNLAKNGEKVVFKLGASWGKIKKSGFLGFGSSEESVDLDLCSFGLSGSEIANECSYRYPKTSYMKSSGDDRSGGVKNGDNEIITLDVSKIPEKIDCIFMTINSFSGQNLDEIPYAKIRVYEGEDNNPVKIHCEFNTENFKNARTLIIGKIYKEDSLWKFEAIGETRSYRWIDDFKKEISNV